MNLEIPGFFRDPTTGKYFKNLPHDVTHFAKKSKLKTKKKEISLVNRKPAEFKLMFSGAVQSMKTFNFIKALALQEQGFLSSSDFSTEILKLKFKQMQLIKPQKVGLQCSFSECQFIRNHDDNLVGAWARKDDHNTVVQELSFNYRADCTVGEADSPSILDVNYKICNILMKHKIIDMCGIKLSNINYVLYVANSNCEEKNLVHLVPRGSMWTFPTSSRSHPDQYTQKLEVDDVLWSCACNSATRTCAVGGELCCYLIQPEQMPKKLKLKAGHPYSLDFSAEGNCLYCGLHNGKIVGKDLRSHRSKFTTCMTVGRGVTNIKLLSNQRSMIASANDGKLENTKSTKGTKSSSKSPSKRQRKPSGSSSSGNESEPSKKKKKSEASADKAGKKAKSRAKIPDISGLDFDSNVKSPSGKKWNLKLSSWNINGIRAWLEKDGISYLHHENPDVLCIQETKCTDDKIPAEVKNAEGYHCYWLSGDKEGYSGVGLLSKQEPIKVTYGIGIKEHDNEGRVITAEYPKFFLVTAYVPNAGRGLVRLNYRMKWDVDFRKYLKKLDSKKPIILCGDLNVAHEEIDIANPKSNKRNAGFTQEERDGFSSLLDEGFVDTFRFLYPEENGAYTFWTYMMNARARNVGWRLDYFVISKSLGTKLCDSVIRKEVYGSDHCPVTLFLTL